MLINIRNPFFPHWHKETFCHRHDRNAFLFVKGSQIKNGKQWVTFRELFLSESTVLCESSSKKNDLWEKVPCSAFTFEKGRGPLSEELASVPPGNDSIAPFSAWKLDLFKTRIKRGTSPHQPSLTPHCLSIPASQSAWTLSRTCLWGC